jgi:hypothetical protein
VSGSRSEEKARRRAARERVGAYHEEQLARLLARVREGFERYDGGLIDAFGLDDLIHRYKRSARELWKFCANRRELVASVIEDEEPGADWWAAGEPRRRRA